MTVTTDTPTGSSIDADSARRRILDSTAALVLEHGVAGVAQRRIAEEVASAVASCRSVVSFSIEL